MNDVFIHFVEQFVANTREHVFVRPEDSLLILRPNRVQYLNTTAAEMLQALYTPAKPDVRAIVAEFTEQYGIPESQVVGDLERLLHSLQTIMQNRPGNAPAVRTMAFGTHRRKYPVISEIALTYRCQNRCFFCYASAPDRGRQVPEMTTGEVNHIIDKISDQARVPMISFTGGEPTLRRDLPELIAYARGRDMRTNLITNGIRCADRAYVAQLVEAGLHSAQVSVEAGEAAVHDDVVGNPGAFEHTLEGVRTLVAAGIHTHTNTTINRRNLEALPGLIDLLADMGQPYLSMNMLIHTGGSVGVEDISYSEIGEIVLQLKQRTENRGMRFVWYSPVPMCLFNTVAHGLGAKSCAAADGLLSVAPDGEVLPCSSFEHGIGNLLHEDFATIWQRRAARYWRNKEFLPPGCRQCEHADLCCGACPLYWDEQGTFEEIHPSFQHSTAWGRLTWRLKRRYLGQVQGVGVKAK
ncbi:MAG: PqqD family peptide modification chaperone [Anaerolineae bacterium]|nr:PqqD family peptide modification chaperone [Anaerolineae bacterium]